LFDDVLTASPRRPGCQRRASGRTVRQQPDRGRPQPTQTPTATDARAAYRPHHASDHHRTRVHAEPAPGQPAYLRHAHRLSRNGLPSNRNARAAAATTNGRSNSRTSRSRWRSPASPPATDRVPIPV